jgi:hypothetical protein
MKAEFIPTPIPKCHICGADAMPNTQECSQHWHERTDRVWGKRWAEMDAAAPAPLPSNESVEAKAS